MLADAVVQHDMDARPLFPRFTLPALNQSQLQPQPAWFDWAKTALLEAHSSGELNGFAQTSSGLIATGDRFISDPAVLQALRDALPNLRAVEMEGAAVAQVAEQEGIPAGAAGDLRWCRRGGRRELRRLRQALRTTGLAAIEALLQRCKTTPKLCE